MFKVGDRVAVIHVHRVGMATRKALCASVLIVCAAFLLQAQNDGPTSTARLASIAESAFNATRCPGLSVAVAKNNVVVYSGAFGFADIEQGVALRTDSAHRLASLSKPVTGTIIMDLVQSGRLKLDKATLQEWQRRVSERFELESTAPNQDAFVLPIAGRILKEDEDTAGWASP